MARPLRFRYSPNRWDETRVRNELLTPLSQNIGARMSTPWFAVHGPYEARRFDMDNGDTALFAWDDSAAYWLGNTETPSALWRTEKYGFEAVPDAIADWGERELLAELHEEEPWLAAFEHLSRFFLPVLCSKDGQETSRAFFRDHAAGFPDADRDTALAYYDDFLAGGSLDAYRHDMAGKLGTSDALNVTRMAATMSEFTVGRLLVEAGYTIQPEIPVATGHSIDYKASRNGDAWLVEVTRPGSPANRQASTASVAVQETVATKTDGQLDAHGGGVTLFVDCSSFDQDAWARLRDEQPTLEHLPVVVFRARPTGSYVGYRQGSVPLELDTVIEWV